MRDDGLVMKRYHMLRMNGAKVSDIVISFSIIAVGFYVDKISLQLQEDVVELV